MARTAEPDKGPRRKDDGQLNVKLSAERYAVLKAAMFVRGTPNLTELVMPILDEFVDDLSSDEAVKLALKARELQEARDENVSEETPSPG